MERSRKETNRLREIGAHLDAAFGRGSYPPQIVGDIDSLLFDTQKLHKILQGLSHDGKANRGEETRALLGDLEQLLKRIPATGHEIIKSVEGLLYPGED